MYITARRFPVTSILILLIMSPAIGVATARSGSISRTVNSQTEVRLGRFSSVELRNGGKVFVRYGATQRVTLLKGSQTYTDVTLAGEDRLVIDKCRNKCPRGYELEVEIVAPYLVGISVAHGGSVEVRGSFPQRNEITVAVSNGGAIDIRSMMVASVKASVDQGGRIFTRPQSAMIASVRQGGEITYWGDAQVISSVQHGGVVTKGTSNEADKPLN